jgi:mono/diheme cytochrome c family protein
MACLKKHLGSSLLNMLLFGLLMTSCGLAKAPDAISGTVLDEHGPIANAVIRVQATDNYSVSDAIGEFRLSNLVPNKVVVVTAWASGYYIAGVEASPGDHDIEIHLHAHTDQDNPEYDWLPSLYHPGQGEAQGCAECHSSENADISFTLPVDEWLLDAHSKSAVNPRFLTMYAGTDISGNQSPTTRYVYNRDYGRFPLHPDPNLPYYGPGFKLDFPESKGNCASCHTPAASVNDPYGIDPTTVTGIAAEGVPCDFCHKVWDVRLDQGEMPNQNMPGVLSFEFRRPPEGDQFFAGPFDDVAPGEDTFSPLQRESQFCAPCHFAVFWDTVVYNSFGEWLESPYSEPASGQTCQDCHMPSLGATHFALPNVGGLERDPATIFSHRMPGASDVELLQNAVTMMVDAKREGDVIIVEVDIINDLTGHHVPTDSPLRQMILLVQVTSPDGESLEQIDGPRIPDYGGVGNPIEGYYAGFPGRVYSKVLMELWTGISPTGAYWNPTRIVSDNRIPALESDTTVYTFEGSTTGEITVDVKLLFRRAFIELMDQKGWDVPDILMEISTLTLANET